MYTFDEKFKKGADRAATQGLVLALIHGVVVTVLSISIMPAFLDMFTNDVQVYQMGMEYAVIVFAFSTITMANLSFEKIFQSVGRMKVSMKIRRSSSVISLNNK